MLVSRLQDMDRSATFRFLDLVPELRLQVYRYVLVGRNHQVLDAPDRAVETALLRTCKTIYIEAEPVLYTDNDFTVAVNLPPGGWSPTVTGPAGFCHGQHDTMTP